MATEIVNLRIRKSDLDKIVKDATAALLADLKKNGCPRCHATLDLSGVMTPNQMRRALNRAPDARPSPKTPKQALRVSRAGSGPQSSKAPHPQSKAPRMRAKRIAKRPGRGGSQ